MQLNMIVCFGWPFETVGRLGVRVGWLIDWLAGGIG